LKHYASTKFWGRFGDLPESIQQLARANYELLRHDPSHPSLRFKQVKNGQYRSVRVGTRFRALGVPVPDGVQWFWIGSHAEYDQFKQTLYLNRYVAERPTSPDKRGNAANPGGKCMERLAMPLFSCRRVLSLVRNLLIPMVMKFVVCLDKKDLGEFSNEV
jgi:hypothetical protein